MHLLALILEEVEIYIILPQKSKKQSAHQTRIDMSGARHW